MKLLILSDLHLEFSDSEPGLVTADVVFLAGGVYTELSAIPSIKRHFPDVPVLNVLGNHEYYGEKIPRLAEKIRKCCAGTNIHVLENSSIEIGDILFFCATL